MHIDTHWILELAQKAGTEIMKIYNASEGIVIDRKADDSPLTKADLAAHHVIVEGLLNKYPEIPIISEESSEEIAYVIRKDYKYFWLVDPLDGTKEFINRNGEFTVNIALIENGYPIEGYIYVPAKETWYYTKAGGAWKMKGTEAVQIHVSTREDNWIAVRSKSHAAPEEEEVFGRYPVTDSISVGSSLKFCMVAEGKADVYYRHGPTMEWDTAAGQAIVEGAGGKVFVRSVEEERFYYNKENLLNSSFLCLGF